MNDSRILKKEEKFFNTFKGTTLYFVVEQKLRGSVNTEYEIMFLTLHVEDFQNMVSNMQDFSKGIYHLFKADMCGNTVEWVESYNGYTEMCDVPIELDDPSWVALAKLSLEKDLPVNAVLVDMLKAYVKKS
jgi:hypothetical protein